MDKILHYFGIKIMNNIQNKKCVYAKKASRGRCQEAKRQKADMIVNYLPESKKV